jgi:hypothetical protein
MDESWTRRCGIEARRDALVGAPSSRDRPGDGRYCTVKVITLLSTPAKLACTVMVKPAEFAESVPVPLPFVSVRFVVSDTIQVTEVVTSCGVLLFGNVAFAVKVTVLLF